MTEVLFVLLPEVVLLDVAGPAEAFRIAEKIAPGHFELAYAAPARSVQTGSGLHIGQLRALPKRVDADTLIVLAGVVGSVPKMQSAPVQQVVQWLRALHAAQPAVPVMGVCAGALLAGAAGLLDGRECTTHHACTEALANIAPAARVRENRIFVEDGPMLTSAGITAGIDAALHVIGARCGAQVACAVAREMVVYLRRTGADAALSPWVEHRNHVHPGVHRVQDAVTADPAADWSAERMARVACTSARHLTRLFTEHAGCTPLDYLHRVRYARARELLMQEGLPIERVAERAGFGSAMQMRRVWRKYEATAPSATASRAVRASAAVDRATASNRAGRTRNAV